MQEYGRNDYVVGEICLPLHRMITTRIAYFLMKMGVPGASWLYFRAFFGPGVDFDVKEIDVDTPPEWDEYRA
jgi:hypothetical protein